MACAPHLSFLVMIFSLLIVWTARPRVGCGGGGFGIRTIFVGVCCANGGGSCGVWVVVG